MAKRIKTELGRKQGRELAKTWRKPATVIEFSETRCFFCRSRLWAAHAGFCASCFRSSQCKGNTPPDELKWAFKHLIHGVKKLVAEDIIGDPETGQISLVESLAHKRIIYGKASSQQHFHVVVVQLFDRNHVAVDKLPTDNHGVFCFLVDLPEDRWPLLIEAYDQKADEDPLYVQLAFKSQMVAQFHVFYRPQLLLFAPIQLPDPEISFKFILDRITEHVSRNSGPVSNDDLTRVGLMALVMTEMAPQQRLNNSTGGMRTTTPRYMYPLDLCRDADTLKAPVTCKFDREEQEEQEDEGTDVLEEAGSPHLRALAEADAADANADVQGLTCEMQTLSCDTPFSFSASGCNSFDSSSFGDAFDISVGNHSWMSTDQDSGLGLQIASDSNCGNAQEEKHICKCPCAEKERVITLSEDLLDKIGETQTLLHNYRQWLQQQLKTACLMELLSVVPGPCDFNLKIEESGISPNMTVSMLSNVRVVVTASQACYVYVIQREGSDITTMLPLGDMIEPNCTPENGGYQLPQLFSQCDRATAGHTLSLFVFAFDRPLKEFSEHLLDGFSQHDLRHARLASLRGARFGKRDYCLLNISLKREEC